MQSPSSINVYKQCPRRYYYQYILKYPTKPSIHLLRGSIIHEVLENFFSLDISGFDPLDYGMGMKNFVSAHLIRLWKKNKSKLMAFGLAPLDLEDYLLDSQMMLNGFVSSFCNKMDPLVKSGLSLKEAFLHLSPRVEEEIVSIELSVRGYIDAVHERSGEVILMDYKTSNKDEITDSYRLQLAIYALLYMERYGIKPAKVGINFLKFGEKLLEVDEPLIQYARQEILFVHERTVSKDINDYPKNPGPLCKWSNGKCDFYEACRPFA